MRYLLFLVFVACAPVTVWEPYEPLIGHGEGTNVACSWGVSPEGLIVTAAHCVYDGVTMNVDGGNQRMRVIEVNIDDDYAVLGGNFPSGALEFSEWAADPDVGEIVCYFDFRGDPNCGHITAVTQESIWFVASTRAIVPGDSGSPLQLQDGDGLAGVMSTRTFGYIGRAARLPWEDYQ